MNPSIVPELAVTDWRASLSFYCDLIGFALHYQRPEEGFAYLRLGRGDLMICQFGLSRDFDPGLADAGKPFGRGLNLQIEVPEVAVVLARLAAADVALHLPLEERWYRKDDIEVGNRQFIVADPDGYLIRLFQDLGARPAS